MCLFVFSIFLGSAPYRGDRDQQDQLRTVVVVAANNVIPEPEGMYCMMMMGWVSGVGVSCDV